MAWRFLGAPAVGDDHHPLPWQVLQYDTDQGGYGVDLDKEMLEGAPRYGTNERVNWEDQAWGRKVHDYYELPPYWI